MLQCQSVTCCFVVNILVNLLLFNSNTDSVRLAAVRLLHTIDLINQVRSEFAPVH